MSSFTCGQYRLFHREQGQGPRLLILPGNTASSAVHLGELDHVGMPWRAVGLDPCWFDPPLVEGVFPIGQCTHGTRLESHWRVIGYDVARRLIRFRRQTRVSRLDGSVVERETIQQRHAASGAEVASWLIDAGLSIEGRSGDYDGHPYTDAAPRAIFWASKGGAV